METSKRGLPKGVSGNPKGRPKKGTALSDLLRARTDKAALADRLSAIALHGEAKDSIAAIRLILEYTEGKPTQTVINHNIDVTALSDDELSAIAAGKG